MRARASWPAAVETAQILGPGHGSRDGEDGRGSARGLHGWPIADAIGVGNRKDLEHVQMEFRLSVGLDREGSFRASGPSAQVGEHPLSRAVHEVVKPLHRHVESRSHHVLFRRGRKGTSRTVPEPALNVCPLLPVAGFLNVAHYQYNASST